MGFRPRKCDDGYETTWFSQQFGSADKAARRPKQENGYGPPEGSWEFVDGEFRPGRGCRPPVSPASGQRVYAAEPGNDLATLTRDGHRAGHGRRAWSGQDVTDPPVRWPQGDAEARHRARPEYGKGASE